MKTSIREFINDLLATSPARPEQDAWRRSICAIYVSPAAAIVICICSAVAFEVVFSLIGNQ
jgi:hypothetical protein